MAVPTIYLRMVDYYDQNGLESRKEEILAKLSKVRAMISGSSPLSEKIHERWEEITGHTLLERYGMTEVGMALTNPYDDVHKRLPGFVGHPFKNVTAGLRNMETGEIHDRMDEEAELVLQSSCMFDRYLDNPEATEATFDTVDG
mmetsp:Transcript_31745/g.48674  ORF Transcript_31745/g.48674 Transcript_31745/m.48674 type:complete len:144 (+) Transcript_31745:784-1215(+)